MTEKLGRYEILEEIGQGGFAIVYRAHDRELDRPVALKELRPMLLADPGSVKNFRQEARNIARLDHPNVVAIYDVYEAEQRQFIVMQLVDGSSLAELIATQGPLSWSKAVEIITALAAGLDYAHSRNILHRDLKPANILLDPDRGPMLTDFGLAKLIGEAGTSVTASGGVVGTPHYIAPEVWEGQGTTPRSDIYALGCTLYEMLVGEKLIPGETPPAVMMAHFKALTLPRSWPEGVPPGVAEVLATALAQKPANRYATAGEMAAALSALARRGVSPPHPETLPEPDEGPAGAATGPVAPPILTTKLYPPPTRPEFVPRPRLIERLNEGLRSGRKLTLISAPAGFGKTTLVSNWVNQKDEGGGMRDEKSEIHPSAFILHPSGVAWLSLDEGDNAPTRFLTYLVAALQTMAPKIGAGALGLLQAPQPPPTETILTTLLNEITSVPDDPSPGPASGSGSVPGRGFVLVLDDYHVIDTRAVDSALTFLLEHLPPPMHLVITTREDPDLPLARLRVRGQLTELRAADLRFTPGEAATFLNQVMDLGLSAGEVTSLETRTEGWIAGLQLAALSIRGRDDVSGFIRAFAGENRYIVDYLVEEVLQRQPARVRSFLLQTSILDRLSGPLCEAVTDQEEGKVMLEALERGNLFVVPLDDKRRWYRYHHLFADVLRAYLMEEQPDRVPTLHRRASEWYEQNGSPAEAIHHALAAEDVERAAGLIELAWPAMDGSFQSATWLGWVKALPDELIRARPVLSVGYAWALLDGGELEAGEARLRDAERWLDPTADSNERPDASPVEMVVVDEEQFRSLPASIATARAYIAQALDDVPGTATHARRALDLLPEEDYLRRGPAAALLGISQWASGDLEAAHRSIADALANFQKTGHITFAISGTYVLADIRLTQGRLNEAISTYERSLQLATEQGEPVLRGTADLYLGLSELYRERDDLEAASRYLLRSEALGEQAALPDWPHRLCLAQARMKEVQGDLDGALDLLDEAQRLYYRRPIPDVRPIAALKTRVWIRQGRLTEALGWARERGLSVDDDLSYLGEFDHLTLARVLIARYKSDRVDRAIHEAMGLLERLLQAAEEGGRTGSVIEILVLQALAHEAQGNVSPALAPLERALTLAEPEGYVRIFVDEGLPVAELLARLNASGDGGPHRIEEYIRKLLPAFGEQNDVHPSAASGTTSFTPQPLVEPLSERELEVLQLIARGLSNREISERLFLALSTVKGHNRTIFGKLQVQRRTEAVARARELGLL